MNWIINVNGLAVENTMELRQLLAPLIQSSDNLETIVPAIFESTQHNQPEEVLKAWDESEPGVMSCVTFTSPPAIASDVTSIVGPRQRPIDVAIATTAATGLLEGMDEFFFIDEGTGFIKINSDHPPTVTQVGTMVDRVMQIRASADRLGEFGNWQLGAITDAGENMYGADFDVSNMIEATGGSYNTVITSLNTFRAFAQQRYQLSFTHHKEAFYSKIPDDENRSLMHRLMEISQYFQLTCSNQRKLFSYVRNYSIEGLEEDIDTDWVYDETKVDEIRAEKPTAILSREELVERITVKEANKNYYFKYAGDSYHIRGVMDSLPRGAIDIICTDDWKKVREDGRESEVPEWQRPQADAVVPST